MNFMQRNKTINFFAEFRDKELEQEYYREEVQDSLRYIRFLFLLFGVVYFCISFYDYGYNTDFSVFARSTIARFGVLLASIGAFFLFRTHKSKNSILVVTVLYAALIVASYMFILIQQDAQGFMEQAMAIMVIILALTLLPAKWIHMVLTNIGIVLCFLLLAPMYINNLPPNVFIEAAIYLLLAILFTNFSMFRINYLRRVQYLKSKQLEHLSTTDSLTGVGNRLWFDKMLSEWCMKQNGNTKSFALVLMDIDDFKKVNDTFGHGVGDSVLIECTKLMCEGIRKQDILARWGGEEFVFLLHDVDGALACEMAERLRKCIEGHEFLGAGRITCSFGVAVFEQGKTAENLMKKVDEQLYYAKNNGKNQVACAGYKK